MSKLVFDQSMKEFSAVNCARVLRPIFSACASAFLDACFSAARSRTHSLGSIWRTTKCNGVPGGSPRNAVRRDTPSRPRGDCWAWRRWWTMITSKADRKSINPTFRRCSAQILQHVSWQECCPSIQEPNTDALQFHRSLQRSHRGDLPDRFFGNSLPGPPLLAIVQGWCSCPNQNVRAVGQEYDRVHEPDVPRPVSFVEFPFFPFGSYNQHFPESRMVKTARLPFGYVTTCDMLQLLGPCAYASRRLQTPALATPFRSMATWL